MAGKWEGAGTSHASSSDELSRETGFSVRIQKVSNDENKGYVTDFEGDGVPPTLIGYASKIANGARYTDELSGNVYTANYLDDDVIFTPNSPPITEKTINQTILTTENVVTYSLTNTVVSPSNSSLSYQGLSVTYPDGYSLSGTTLTLTLPFPIESGELMDLHYQTLI